MILRVNTPHKGEIIMRVVGIDQSYTSCGIVVLEDGIIIHVERFVSHKEADTYSRAWSVAQRVFEVVDMFKPDRVALEGLSFGARGDATRDLGGLLYVIICTLRFIGNVQQVDILPPQSVKKFATGSGKADKNQMIEALPESVRQKFDGLGVKKTTGLADLADAYHIARYIYEHNESE